MRSIQVVIYDGCWPWLGSGYLDGNLNGNKVGLKHRHKNIKNLCSKKGFSLSLKKKFSKLVSDNVFGEL